MEIVGKIYCLVTLVRAGSKEEAYKISNYLNSLGFETIVKRNEVRMFELGFDKASKLAKKFAKKNSIKVIDWIDLKDYCPVTIEL